MGQTPFHLLIVGSHLDAHLALESLSSLSNDVQLHHLPTAQDVQSIVFPVSKSDWSGSNSAGSSATRKARLTDVWGKSLLELDLPDMVLVDPRKLGEGSYPGVKQLAPGLSVSRVQPSGDSFLVAFSDGSELLVNGVIFADGRNSMAGSFWKPVQSSGPNPHGVRSWTFENKDLLGIQAWEFRWAPAKSIEILPLPNKRIRVTLRFKSPFGSNLSISELGDLFSEFGADMGALLEGVSEETIQSGQEEKMVLDVFSPAPGCVALGEAAWPRSPMRAFSWVTDLVSSQVKILREQAQSSSFNAQSLEAQSKELMLDFNKRERFLRRGLHYDNVVFRPFINFLLRFCPKSVLRKKLREKIAI